MHSGILSRKSHSHSDMFNATLGILNSCLRIIREIPVLSPRHDVLPAASSFFPSPGRIDLPDNNVAMPPILPSARFALRSLQVVEGGHERRELLAPPVQVVQHEVHGRVVVPRVFVDPQPSASDDADSFDPTRA
jgi:hypothetical protein